MLNDRKVSIEVFKTVKTNMELITKKKKGKKNLADVLNALFLIINKMSVFN